LAIEQRSMNKITTDWTEKEHKENIMLTEILLAQAFKEQKEQGRTTEQFIHSIMMALSSLVNDAMITLDEGALLAQKYIYLYDSDWKAPI
jgi:hypothetical protein